MSKPPKFLICENPMTADNDGRLFILHSREPVILAEVLSYEDITEAELMQEMRSLGPIAGKLVRGDETFLFNAIWIQPGWEIAFTERLISRWYNQYQNNGGSFTREEWNNDGRYSASDIAQDQADELAGIMRRMADWYEAYLNWEDQQ